MPTTDSVLTDSGPAGTAPPVTVTHAEIGDFAAAIGLTSAAPDRCSSLLMFDLYLRAFYPVPGDPCKIVAEIRGLEGLGRPTRTKPADQFMDRPLQGLWKKHYLLGGLSSVAKNIQNGFGRNQKELRRIVERHRNPTTDHLSPEVISQNIANAVTALYAKRSREQRLTGEWIVYAQYEGQNYYLCLASHKEGATRKEGDARVFERLKNGCVGEFPFLRSQLGLC